MPTYIFCLPCYADHSSGALFLPFAISTRDLRQRIKEALIDDHPEGLEVAGIKIPSLTWLEYQFAPANVGYANCLRHTGIYMINVVVLHIYDFCNGNRSY